MDFHHCSRPKKNGMVNEKCFLWILENIWNSAHRKTRWEPKQFHDTYIKIPWGHRSVCKKDRIEKQLRISNVSAKKISFPYNFSTPLETPNRSSHPPIISRREKMRSPSSIAFITCWLYSSTSEKNLVEFSSN